MRTNLAHFAATVDSVDKGARDDDTEEATVDPGRALEAIVSAERELVVMHDLTKNVENLRTISVQYVDAALSEQEKLLVTAAAVERRKKDLRAASTRLRAVAKQMRAEVEQDRVFIRSLSDLQVLHHCGLHFVCSVCSLHFDSDSSTVSAKLRRGCRCGWCRHSGGYVQQLDWQRRSSMLRWCSL